MEPTPPPHSPPPLLINCLWFPHKTSHRGTCLFSVLCLILCCLFGLWALLLSEHLGFKFFTWCLFKDFSTHPCLPPEICGDCQPPTCGLCPPQSAEGGGSALLRLPSGKSWGWNQRGDGKVSLKQISAFHSVSFTVLFIYFLTDCDFSESGFCVCVLFMRAGVLPDNMAGRR